MNVDKPDQVAASAVPATSDNERGGADAWSRIASAVLTATGLTLVAFHVYTAGAGPLTSFQQRAVHVALAVVVCAVIPVIKREAKAANWRTVASDAAAVLWAIVAVVAAVYVFYHFDRIVYDLGYVRPTRTDIVLGCLVLVAVFDSARRVMGWPFPIIGGVLLLYGMFGDHAPGVLRHSGLSLETAVANSFISPLGVYGNITATSANQIAIFVIFGGLLMALGGGSGFLKLALVIAGRRRGGPGKVAALGSAFFGMINGSAVANSASTGSMTIPMMKQYGFKPRFAAAVEATASTGGQWTPPIMGAAVFLMAQLLGVPYYEVAAAAIIPAIIYYIAFWVTIHCEARRQQLQPIPAADIPKIRDFRDELVILVPPVIALVGLIIAQYPVRIAGFAGVVTLLVSSALVHFLWHRRSPGEYFKKLAEGSRAAAQTVATIAVLVAGSQVVVAMIGNTGLALNLGRLIFQFASISVVLALVLAAFINLVLGLSLPTVPSYLIAIAITAPALEGLGVEPIAIHMFALFFAVIGGMTPPIGATVFVTAAIAQTNWLGAGLTALRICAIGFVLPFVFSFQPALLLVGTPLQIGIAAVSCAAGAVLLATVFSRHSVRPMPWWELLIAAALATALLVPELLSAAIGGVGAVVLWTWWWRNRNRYDPLPTDPTATEKPPVETER